jgi:LysR family transcriptional regulator, glycine cleavage system transcriptional activator
MGEWLPPIQALRAFVAAVRSGSFLAAGSAIGLSHGAVSHHVAQLEHAVGTKLFDRHRRGAVPTPDAEELARRVARSLDDLREAIADARGERHRSVSVTLTPALAQRWLISRLSEFLRIHPDVDLRIRPVARVLDLDIERIDVAFRWGAGRWAGTNPSHVADEWVFPVASPNYRGGMLPTRPEQLDTCLLIRNPLQDWQPWLAAADVPNIKPRGPTVDDAGLALDLAARGEGVALARSLLARSDIEAGRLVPLFDLAIRDRFAYWLVVRPGIERRSDVSALTEWIRQACIDSVGPPVFKKVAPARSNVSKRKRTGTRVGKS